MPLSSKTYCGKRLLFDRLYPNSYSPQGDLTKYILEISSEPKVDVPKSLTFLLCFAANKNCSAELPTPSSIIIPTCFGKGNTVSDVLVSSSSKDSSSKINSPRCFCSVSKDSLAHSFCLLVKYLYSGFVRKSIIR